MAIVGILVIFGGIVGVIAIVAAIVIVASQRRDDR